MGIGLMERKKQFLSNNPHLESLDQDGILTVNTNITAPLQECRVYFFPIQSRNKLLNETSVETKIQQIYGWTKLDLNISPTLYTGDGMTFHIDWGQIFGNIYGGYFDFVENQLVQEYDSIIFTGEESEEWSYDGEAFSCIIENLTNEFFTPICDRYICTIVGAYEHEIRIPKTKEISSLQQWKNKLHDEPIIVVYKNINPIIHSFQPMEVKIFSGINNIWSNTNGNIKIKYWKY